MMMIRFSGMRNNYDAYGTILVLILSWHFVAMPLSLRCHPQIKFYDHAPEFIDSKDVWTGNTGLHLAVKYSHFNITLYLLGQGAQVSFYREVEHTSFSERLIWVFDLNNITQVGQ